VTLNGALPGVAIADKALDGVTCLRLGCDGGSRHGRLPDRVSDIGVLTVISPV
jgi:hypothetical protein